MKRRAFIAGASALACGGVDVGSVFSPSGSFTPASVAGFWWAADDAAPGNPASLVDRIGGALMTPVGATGGLVQATGWGGQQKAIKQSGEAWKCTDAGVVARLTGGRNFWMCLVGMQLATNASPAVAPDQTLLSAGSSSDAQKFFALQERNKVAATIGGKQFSSQRWIQRFGAGAQTADESTNPTGPLPWVWFVQVDNAGVFQIDSLGLTEQGFTRSTGGALTVDALVWGGLIQGAVTTPDARLLSRHLFGNSGNLTLMQQAQVYAWLAGDTRGIELCKGLVGSWATTVFVQVTEWDQSNGQDQTTPPTLTAPRCFNLGFNSFAKPLAAPWCDATGTPFTSVFINSGVGAPNAFCNQMAALGKYNTLTEALFLIPGGVGGSSLGSFWCKNLTTDPWGWDAPVGAQNYRREWAMRNLPNAVLLPSPDYQGESDTLSFSQADGWDDANRAPAVAAAYVTWATARGYARKAATPERAICILPATNWTSATPLNWLTQRNAANAAAAAIPNSVAIQVDDGDWIGGPGGDRLHIGATAQTSRYQAIAAVS